MTKKKSQENSEQVDARYPDVILDFEYTSGQLYAIIENIGEDSAFDVIIKFNKRILGIQKTKNISSLSIFNSLKFLPPKKKIKIFVDSFQSYVLSKQPLKIKVVISFKNKLKKEFRNTITHDLSIYEDLFEFYSIKIKNEQLPD